MSSIRKIAKKAKSALFLPELSASVSYRFFGAARPNHAMPFELIVSLTSYPKRFATLAFTIKSLRSQKMVPDKIILWVYEGDMKKLPKAVTDLEDHVFQIRTVDKDLKSFKKLIPATIAHPDACIVTTDDDLFYNRSWLANLMHHVSPDRKVIYGTRGHRIRKRPDGEFAPYKRWKHNVSAGEPGADIMLTSGAGMAFLPGALGPGALDQKTFMALCPTADDLWFYFQLRQQGYTFCKVGEEFQLFSWRTSQKDSLWAGNQQDGNDQAFKNLTDAFGPPF